MFAFLLLFAVSANETEKPQQRVEPKAPKDKGLLEKGRPKKEESDDEGDLGISDILDAINTTQLFDALDDKVDDILDSVKSEAKVFTRKAEKEIKRGAKKLEKKLKKLFHKKHHKPK